MWVTMGSLKEYYLDNQENRYIQLAQELQISWEELLSLEYDIAANVSNDGLIYGYILSFTAENNKNILSKIHGLSEHLTVDVGPWVFERSEEDEYELSAISENVNYESNFLLEIENLEQLFEIEVENSNLRKILLRQIFISIIGAVETYLSDAFINKALSKESYLHKFVENNPEFKKQKISLSEIFNVSRSIEEKAKTIMVGTIYHKLPIVKEMYKQTFNIEFPNISEMQKYIAKRHDLVHRNGKTTNGEIVIVNNATISELKNCAVEFVKSVSKSFDFEHIPF